MAVDANGNEIIQPASEANRSQERIQQLSEKVELTAKERDEMKGLVGERDKTIAELQKENTFNSGFSDMLGTYSAAKDHKDEIKTKVLAGYSVEDATLAVLGKAGKLGSQAAPASTPQIAGGSAVTNPQSGHKETKDMTLAEKREALSKEIVWG